MLELGPMKAALAADYLKAHSVFDGKFDFAIAATDDKDDRPIRGIIAVSADGETFALAHIWTDGSPQVGSLLYGAAWRAAKALGYKVITI